MEGGPSPDLVTMQKKDTLLPSGILQREETTVVKEDSGVVITKKMSLLKQDPTKVVLDVGGGAGRLSTTDGISSTPVKKGDSGELLQNLSKSAEELKKSQVKNTAAQGLHIMSTRACGETAARLNPPLSIFTCSGSAALGVFSDQTEVSLASSQLAHTEAKSAVDEELKLRVQKGQSLGKLERLLKK